MQDIKTQAIEGVMYLLFSALLVSTIHFLPQFLIVGTTILSTTFLASYVLSFDLKQRTTVTLVGGIGVVFPVLIHILSLYISLNDNILLSFVGVVLIIMVVGFGVQIIREEHADAINTIAHSIVLAVLLLCSYGFVMAASFYNGLVAGFVQLCILPYAGIGVLLLACSLFSLLLKRQVLSGVWLLLAGGITLLITAVGANYIFNELGIASISYLHFACSLFVLLFSYTVTWAQFGSGQYLPAALLRVSFPLVTTGIFTYIVVLFTWS